MENYIKSYNDFFNESDETKNDNAVPNRIEALKAKAQNYQDSPTEHKLKIKLNSDFNTAFNYILDKLEHNGIYDKNSVEAEKVYNDEIKNILLPALKATYYQFSVGKFTDLNKISFDEFINIYNKELDSFNYKDLIQNFANRIKIASQASENIYKEIEYKGQL